MKLMSMAKLRGMRMTLPWYSRKSPRDRRTIQSAYRIKELSRFSIIRPFVVASN